MPPAILPIPPKSPNIDSPPLLELMARAQQADGQKIFEAPIERRDQLSSFFRLAWRRRERRVVKPDERSRHLLVHRVDRRSELDPILGRRHDPGADNFFFRLDLVERGTERREHVVLLLAARGRIGLLFILGQRSLFFPRGLLLSEEVAIEPQWNHLRWYAR